MDKKENDFSLEDILKEFGQESDEDAWEKPEDPSPAPAEEKEDVLIWDGNIPPASQKNSEDLQDTVRLDQITQAVRKHTSEDLQETVRFTPVGMESEPLDEPSGILEEEETVEPYSEDWEPEYEQPISDYIPPQPIVFRPKSRLQELKRKLVEGPEKRYYELTELGLGKLQFAIFMNLLVALLSAGSTALYSLGMIPDTRLRFLIFIQFLSLLLSALFGSYQLMEGVQDLLHKRFTPNTLLIFSLVACCADGILCLKQLRIPCCAAFSLNMTMSLWGAYQRRNTELGQMDTMRKAVRLDSLTSVPDYYEGASGFLRGTGQVEDFMDHYNVSSTAEKTLSVYSLIALFVSLASGITAGVLHSMTLGIQVFAASLLVAVPATAYITVSRPMALLERRLHKLGAVLCGWKSVRTLSKTAFFPLTDEDLFPGGTVKMNGVKFYGKRKPDDVIAYGTALVNAAGGVLVPLFNQLLDSRSGYHYTADRIRCYGNGGVGGEVNEEAVLAGTLSFMQSMGVEMPEGTRVNQAVYVAIDGQLSGVFAISYGKTKAYANGLQTLCSYRGLTPVLTANDFLLTESFLRSKFGINTKKIALPNGDVRRELAEKVPPEDSQALVLLTHGGLAGAAYSVTGARALQSAVNAGVAVHMLGGILGLIMMLVLAILNADYLLTPANVLLYELIWMIPGFLITEWTRII